MGGRCLGAGGAKHASPIVCCLFVHQLVTGLVHDKQLSQGSACRDSVRTWPGRARARRPGRQNWCRHRTVARMVWPSKEPNQLSKAVVLGAHADTFCSRLFPPDSYRCGHFDSPERTPAMPLLCQEAAPSSKQPGLGPSSYTPQISPPTQQDLNKWRKAFEQYATADSPAEGK